MKNLVITLLLSIGLHWSYAQTLTQTVRGKVVDQTNQEELIGATISLVGSDPVKGTATGIDGTFVLEGVPVGRQSFEFRMMGYESFFVTEVLVGSAREVVIDVALKQEATSLEAITVVYKADKSEALNEMATVSSRQFTVEETQRYAGGLNDPARLVSTFAGVASPSISSNGISVRGNSPAGLLWRIEGVDIPSPNHFADLTIAGAGALTVLSAQTMSNSDFYTGAFPSEYGNATSGVFDINLRSGNSNRAENTFQAGILGVEYATEGPFKKGSESTYLLNYRYSTMALIAPSLPSDAGILKYQDLSFKVKMPTKKSGTFSIWGLGGYDGIDMEAQDSLEWKSKGDRENSQTSMYMFASGINHRITLNAKAFLNTTVAFSGNGLSFDEQFVDDEMQAQPQSYVQNRNAKLTLQSSLTSYFGKHHFNRSGFYVNRLGYNLAVNDAPNTTSLPESILDETGQSMLIQFFSQSQFDLAPRLALNAGFHSQYFELNNDFTFEPRISLKYNMTERSDIALAFGSHSKTESLPLYFIKDENGDEPNKNLKLMRSNHVVLSFNSRINDHLRLSIEPYYQYLRNIPVAADSYISTINVQNNLLFNEALVSTGTGRNIGVDFTLERFLNKGYYYMLTASIFDSKYKSGDGIERNTRFNKNYVANAVVGREWQVGKNDDNTLSINFRLNYLGGNRVEPIDVARTIDQQEVVYGETGGQIAFEQKHRSAPISSFTFSYRRNKQNHSSVWALQVLNSGSNEEYDTDIFNLKTKGIETKYTGIVVPNLSYKIEF